MPYPYHMVYSTFLGCDNRSSQSSKNGCKFFTTILDNDIKTKTAAQEPNATFTATRMLSWFMRLRICANNINPALPTLRTIAPTTPSIQSSRKTDTTRSMMDALVATLANANIFCQIFSSAVKFWFEFAIKYQVFCWCSGLSKRDITGKAVGERLIVGRSHSVAFMVHRSPPTTSRRRLRFTH